MFHQLAVDVAQAEDLAGAEVAVYIGAVQPWDCGAAIDVSTDDRAGFTIQRVFPIPAVPFLYVRNRPW